ncbi:hypothetical protein KSF78_0000767 [Schistosoma japonicum]|uniref:Uncharacterized protein n=1 Tax=Schistosoma japonicum TaxID=6182 RepID=C1LIA9_SCHJA|nr:hypothetical protein KSF78_0000767 [Schistosoma japonicum]CAX74437.1 hypothetical protein [Schistosoma japonicum]
MNGTTIASYECITPTFLDIDNCRNFKKTSECNGSHSNKNCDSGRLFITDDCISNKNTPALYPKSDQSFDEEVQITEMEEVKTPRITSPTLDELKKRLASISPNSKLTENPVTFESNKINSQPYQKLLSEVSSKPCAYPLNRLCDEYIPVRSRIRPIKGKLGFGNEVHFGDQKSRITFHTISSKNSLNLLKNMPVCSLPSPLLRQTYSSSGSLIPNLTNLSFNNDAILSIPLSSGSHVSEVYFDSIFSSKGDSAHKQDINQSAIQSVEDFHFNDKFTYGSVLNNISSKNGVKKAIFDSNPGLREIHDTDMDIIMSDSHINSDEQCYMLYTQSQNPSCLREKNRTGSKRPENKKPIHRTVTPTKSDSSCTEVSTHISNTNVGNENIISSCNGLVESDSSNKLKSETRCNSSSNVHEDEVERKVSFNDCNNGEMSSSLVRNLPTQSIPSNIVPTSASFPASYINEEPTIADEDFTPVTNKKLRRKQQQHSKMVQRKTCNSEPSFSGLNSNTYSQSSKQSVNNGTFQQRHITHRLSTSLSKHYMQRSRMYSSMYENSQSFSARPTGFSPNPQDTLSRKPINTDIVSSLLSNSNHFRPVSNSYPHTSTRDSPSRKSVYISPSSKPLRHSKEAKRPSPNSTSVILSCDVQATLPLTTKESVSSVQYELLKQFMMSSWASFAKFSKNTTII